jgi:TRAP-type C4-dicarboxylate transport system permease small subunit
MYDRSPWKILVAEVGYFLFVIIGIYAGYRFWSMTSFATMGNDGGPGRIVSGIMLVLMALAMVPIFLLSLRRVLLKYDIIPKEASWTYLWSRTWFVRK